MLSNGSKTETQDSYTVASEFSERDCDINTTAAYALDRIRRTVRLWQNAIDLVTSLEYTKAHVFQTV